MFEWTAFVAPFAIYTSIGLLFYLVSRRNSSKKNDLRDRTYTCGEEDFVSVHIGPENFYQPVKRSLGMNAVRRMHTGNISDYLLWVLVGIVALILIVPWI